MGHTCHANFCSMPCKPEHLMCAYHWRMVPIDVQAMVCGNYRKGQCEDKRVTREYIDSSYLAQALVAEVEHKGMNGFQRKQLAIYKEAVE